MIGLVVSHYRIEAKLGEGGMGEVYLARDISSPERKVALKFPPAEMQEDEVAKKRLLREASAAAAIDHPFICAIHEIGDHDGKIFLALEYVDGPTLEDLLEDGPIDRVEALRIAREIADALEKAHQTGIVHRDLKPSNVMLTGDGHVKIMDFGLAKLLEPVGSVEKDQDKTPTVLTSEDNTPGTLAYMSPEQLLGREVDTRSDIFSLGIVLYEIFTGSHPFQKPHPMETADSILNEEPPPWNRFQADGNELLERSVAKMLSKKPDERPQSITEVASNLADSRRSATLKPPQATIPKRTWLWTAILAALLLLFFAWLISHCRTLSPSLGAITSLTVRPLDNAERFHLN